MMLEDEIVVCNESREEVEESLDEVCTGERNERQQKLDRTRIATKVKRTVYKMIAKPAMIWFGDFSTNKRVDAEMDFCWK